MNSPTVFCIKCRNNGLQDGCKDCHDVRWLRVQLTCPLCQRSDWFTSRELHTYEQYGNTYRSITGMVMVAHKDRRHNCIDCELEHRAG